MARNDLPIPSANIEIRMPAVDPNMFVLAKQIVGLAKELDMTVEEVCQRAEQDGMSQGLDASVLCQIVLGIQPFLVK